MDASPTESANTPESTQPTTNPISGEAVEPKKIELSGLFDALYSGYGPNGNDQAEKGAKELISKYLLQVASKHETWGKYNTIVVFDSSQMVKEDADHVYNALTHFAETKPLLMILYSRGGDIGAAYLIGKLCREYSNESFIVAVPRVAKSAATLLACAADEIHMGSISELGPIDPQIDELPALGLKNSIEHIAQLVKKTPEAAEMFAKYLHLSLRLIDLGHYERVAESATQYAERLLATHADKLTRQVTEIAQELVYSYKDHGFVIDTTEASRIFGPNVVKHNTAIYSLANDVYKAISLIGSFLDWLNCNFYLIGCLDSEPNIRKRKT
jgi:hypothetical protein